MKPEFPEEFRTAIFQALETSPHPVIELFAKALEGNRSYNTDGHPHLREAADCAPDLPGPEIAAWIRGAIAAHQYERRTRQIEVVWSGPSTTHVPVRSTSQALLELIKSAQHELVLTTYSARPYPPVLLALFEVQTRGVTVDIVVETLSGAGTALSGDEPAAAFADLPGVRLWHWPRQARPTHGAKMHAKLAVVDRSQMLVSSVNLTESGLAHSMEAGVIVRGGHAPRRFAEHIESLCVEGTLLPLGP